MTKPKEKIPPLKHLDPPTDPYESPFDAYDRGWQAGLRDGEKRLARALRRFLDSEMFLNDHLAVGKVYDWLSARQKKERK